MKTEIRVPEEGERFGKLVAIREVRVSKNHTRHWLFRCDCGKEKVMSTRNIILGKKDHCGCEAERYKYIGQRDYDAQMNMLRLMKTCDTYRNAVRIGEKNNNTVLKAQAAGMTYGQYQAMLLLKKMEAERNVSNK